MGDIIKGKLIEGQKIGRVLGFPTINLSYDGDISGVFAGEVCFNGECHKAAVHVGKRPTINDDKPICEAFLLNFSGEISPGTEIEVRLIEKIRERVDADSLCYISLSGLTGVFERNNPSDFCTACFSGEYPL